MSEKVAIAGIEAGAEERKKRTRPNPKMPEKELKNHLQIVDNQLKYALGFMYETFASSTKGEGFLAEMESIISFIYAEGVRYTERHMNEQSMRETQASIGAMLKEALNVDENTD